MALTEEAVPKVNANQLDMMRHALGMNYSPRHERNMYCASLEQGQPPAAIRQLVDLGLMISRNTINAGEMQYFQVTPEGQRVVESLEPPPKKLSRSQARYERYRAVSDVMTFREWLAYEADERRGHHAH